jgi:hypothetical protein
VCALFAVSCTRGGPHPEPPSPRPGSAEQDAGGEPDDSESPRGGSGGSAAAGNGGPISAGMGASGASGMGASGVSGAAGSSDSPVEDAGCVEEDAGACDEDGGALR